MSIVTWYRQVKARYAPKPRRPYEYLVNHYYAHRVDPILTAIADRAGISPNTVTLISLAAGLGAAASILGGWFITAALLIQLHHLLDGVDGNLARYHNRCTRLGKQLDIITDQIVRLAISVSLAWVSDVPAWLGLGMLATLYLDLLIVKFVVVPISRRHPLIRDRWKQRFMDRGLMPAFDIFFIYLLTSLCLALQRPDLAVVLTLILKTTDWMYRLYECARTAVAGRPAKNAL